MAGRGRGRGRGTPLLENRPGIASNGATSPIAQPKTSNESKEPIAQKAQPTASNERKEPIAQKPQTDPFEDLCSELKTFKLLSTNDLITDLVKKAKDCSKSGEQCFQVIDILYQKVFQDNEFAAKVAELGNGLSSLEGIGTRFRSCLLKRAQEHYKNKENLKKSSTTKWTGLLCLICEIFKVLRIGGSPLKPLAGSIYEMFGEILQNLDDNEQIECFHLEFRNIGKMLQEVNKAKMEELTCKIRDSILSEKSSSETRCLLTELLELQASSWTLNPEVERFYSDAMADILALQG